MAETSHQSRARQQAAAPQDAESQKSESTERPPFLTADLPGIGGTLKSEPEDFLVEEIPAYEPSGEGEHLLLWNEKRDVSADDLLQHVAESLEIRRDDVGTAGLKDRRAVTRQFVSVPATCADRIGAVDGPGVRVLRSERHGNKLRTGHLNGNRFEIVLRQTTVDAIERAERIGESIRRDGFPNYYGDQRFGGGGETLALGFDLLAGRKKPRDVPHRQRRFLLRLALSSVQSALFNDVLAARLSDGLLHTVLEGDVMQKRETGGIFVAEDVAAEQSRFDAGEIVPTGPMFGPKMRRTLGESAGRESAVLKSRELQIEQFSSWKRLLPGTRRPLLAFASGLVIEQTEPGIRLTFSLDRGVYATTLLREFQKNDDAPQP